MTMPIFNENWEHLPALHVSQVQNLSVHLLTFIYFGVQTACLNRPTYNATFGNKSKGSQQ